MRDECEQHTPNAGAAVGPDYDYIVECYEAEKRRADMAQQRYEQLVKQIGTSLSNREAGRPWNPAAQVRALMERNESLTADVERFIRENEAQRQEIQEARAALRVMAFLVAEAEAKAKVRAR